MPALWDLNLSNNRLETLPPSMATLTKVSELYVSNNRLKELPSFIGRLSTLTFASVNGNELTKLPTSMVALTNLKHFYAQHNALEGPLPQLDHVTCFPSM
jgi:Leucine-rich repeat (LRR) protein